MTWDNRKIMWVPGLLVTSAHINTYIMGSLKYIKGEQSAQTEIVLESRLDSGGTYIELTDANADIKKRFKTPSVTAKFKLLADDAHVPSAIEDGYVSALSGALENEAEDQESLGSFVWTRIGQDTGTLGVTPAGMATPALYMDESGNVGLLLAVDKLPEYDLDINGTVNVTGNIRIAGSTITDWSEAAGVVTWTGNSRVEYSDDVGNYFGKYFSQIATGTKAIDVTSTTVCPNLAAEKLDGFGWHRGLKAEGFLTTLGTSDTDIDEATITLNRAGKWFCASVITFDAQFDTNQLFTAKIKDSSGTQIGASAECLAKNDSEQIAVLAMGFYTAAVGTEVIKVTGKKAAGSDVAGASADLIAVWIGQ